VEEMIRKIIFKIWEGGGERVKEITWSKIAEQTVDREG